MCNHNDISNVPRKLHVPKLLVTPTPTVPGTDVSLAGRMKFLCYCQDLFLIIFNYVCVRVHAHTRGYVQAPQRLKTSDSWALELQTVGSYPTRVLLGIKRWSSGRAARASNP